jgi:hypothetical protein
LVKSPGAKRIWKYARRKFEQARHLLDELFGIFEGADDEDDDVYVDGSDGMLGGAVSGDNFRSGKNNAAGAGWGPSTGGAGGGGAPNGRFGSEVDESFLKSRYEAMMKAAANEN